MADVGEVLNLEYHIVRLTLKALNIADSRTHAASLLGITKRTLQAYIKEYNIVLNDKNDYVSPYTFKIVQISHIQEERFLTLKA